MTLLSVSFSSPVGCNDSNIKAVERNWAVCRLAAPFWPVESRADLDGDWPCDRVTCPQAVHGGRQVMTSISAPEHSGLPSGVNNSGEYL